MSLFFVTKVALRVTNTDGTVFARKKNDGPPFESGPRRKVVIQNRLVLRTLHFLRYLMAFTLSRYHFPAQWDSYDRI